MPSCVYFSDNKLKLGAADSNPAVFWDTGEGRSPQHKQTNKASQQSTATACGSDAWEKYEWKNTNKQTKPASSPQRQRVEATRGRSTSGKSTAQLEAERRNYIFNYIFNIWSCFIWSCFNQKHCSLKPCSCVYFSDNKLKLGAADSNPAVFWDTGEGRSPQHKQTNKASQHSQRLRVEATRGRSTSGKSTAQLEAERRNYIFNIWSCFIWSCFNQKHCSLKPCSCVYFSDNKLKLGAADSNPAVFWDTGEGRSPQHKQTKPASIHSDGVWKRRVGEVRVEKVQRS
ncbi:UNVERIFIED_CONTAM: hypothetical protein FKN15_023755 [Acipenser sinensis]